MFGRDYDFSLISTSSKEALLRSAMMVSGNDIKKASEICDYVIKLLPDIPDHDVVPPTGMEQLKDTAVQVFNWGKENQEQIVGVINMIMRLFGKQPVVTEVPPPIA